MDNCGKYYVLRYFLPFLFVSFSSFSHISGLDLFLPRVTFVIDFVSGGRGNSLKGMIKGHLGCGRSSHAANICSYSLWNSVFVKCKWCGSKYQTEIYNDRLFQLSGENLVMALMGEYDQNVRWLWFPFLLLSISPSYSWWTLLTFDYDLKLS